MAAKSTDMAAPSMRREETHFELVGDREHVMTRTFAAPRALVFEVWTTPAHVRRWWAPATTGMHMVECEIDLRVGGKYRFLTRRADGFECGFRGEYREIDAPGRLVYTEVFDLAPDAPSIVTVVFEEQDGETKSTVHALFASPEARAAAVDSGMERGVRECMRQIDELLASLSRKA
jgi:uncharacterized protein YndB with AHSA1/START domain